MRTKKNLSFFYLLDARIVLIGRKKIPPRDVSQAWKHPRIAHKKTFSFSLFHYSSLIFSLENHSWLISMLVCSLVAFTAVALGLY